MSVPFWAIEMAVAFWQDAGGEEGFPRSLRRSIANAVPLTVVLLPKLRLVDVGEWLREQDVFCQLDMHDRSLRACLVARYGQGIVFLDGSDPDDEQRFSLAHEVAHFLKEYWWPRRVVAESLGSQALEVLDGARPARHEERVHALLAHVSIGIHIHLMERNINGSYVSAVIDTAERDADILAYELLAPSSVVLGEIASYPPIDQREAVTDLLTSIYRLPAAVATSYASLLVQHEDRADSFLRRIGLNS